MLSLTSLEADEELAPEARDQIRLIRRNVELEARLIDDLLDVTRIANGKIRLTLSRVDLHECIDHVLKVAQPDITAKQLKVETKLGAKHPVIAGDAARIRQIFFNLFSNAIKFTPKGHWIRVTTASEKDHIRIDVTDSGIGIPENMIPLLFQRFQQGGGDVTRRFGGLGLGLSICRSLAIMHGGTVTARSEGEGKGATFTLRLPVDLAKIEALPATDPNQFTLPLVLAKPRVLLVEDHSDTRQTLARLLRRDGHEVFTAESVDSALKEADRNEFELLLSDIGLPDGNGLQIMSALCKRHIRGIAISGFGTDRDIQASLEAGFAMHLPKPVDFDRLRAAIAEVSAGATSGNS